MRWMADGPQAEEFGQKKKWYVKTYPNCPLIPIQSFLQLLQPIQALRQRCSQSGSDVDGYGKHSSVNST